MSVKTKDRRLITAVHWKMMIYSGALIRLRLRRWPCVLRDRRAVRDASQIVA